MPLWRKGLSSSSLYPSAEMIVTQAPSVCLCLSRGWEVHPVQCLSVKAELHRGREEVGVEEALEA